MSSPYFRATFSSDQLALENFSAIVKYEEFTSLPVPRLSTYPSSDLIYVRAEETVFEAALSWIAHVPDMRTAHACSRMEHIRLAKQLIYLLVLLNRCQMCDFLIKFLSIVRVHALLAFCL